jgi:hypothetical protein
MRSFEKNQGAGKCAAGEVEGSRIQSARDCFKDIRGCICSALTRDVHAPVWALEQMTAQMEKESSLASDVKAWRKVIEAYDELFELVQPRSS